MCGSLGPVCLSSPEGTLSRASIYTIKSILYSKDRYPFLFRSICPTILGFVFSPRALLSHPPLLPLFPLPKRILAHGSLHRSRTSPGPQLALPGQDPMQIWQMMNHPTLPLTQTELLAALPSRARSPLQSASVSVGRHL